MNEDYIKQEEQNFSFNDYWPSIGIVGAIFSLISFVAGLFFGYQQINSEPTGSFFSPIMLSGVIVCLVTSLAGLLAVWHFTREVSPKLKLGQGAVIGFLTGAVIVVISVILSELWIMLVDPEYTKKILESTIANIEAMDMPQSAKDDMIDAMAESIEQSQSFLRQIFWGVPITGLLNLITALIGVKLFAEKEEETF
jgi:magnesium-transporting ATPase (P-type)